MLLLDAAGPQAAGLRGDGSDDERAVQPEAQWPSRGWIMEGHGGPHHPLGHLGPWRIPQNSNSVVFQMSFQTNRLTNIYELDGLKKIQVEDHPNSQISVMESVSALDSTFHVSGVLLQSGM